ncbi:hypothetical protein V8D89_010022 [Ganoderma adspersum]
MASILSSSLPLTVWCTRVLVGGFGRGTTRDVSPTLMSFQFDAVVHGAIQPDSLEGMAYDLASGGAFAWRVSPTLPARAPQSWPSLDLSSRYQAKQGYDSGFHPPTRGVSEGIEIR